MHKIKKLIKDPRDYIDGTPDTLPEYFILFVIFVNLISLGLETTTFGREHLQILYIIDQVCLFVFILELLFKAIIFKKDFFKYKWNIFDLIIVIISIFATLPYFAVFRVFKLISALKTIKGIKGFRAVKIIKMVDSFDKLRLILKAILKSLQGIFWTASLLLIVYYIFAIIGTNLFSETFPLFFGNLGKSFLSLFQIMTFDSWCSQIARPVIQTHTWAWLYFVTFTFSSSFVIMNVIVGIVVDSIEESKKESDFHEKGIKIVSNEELYKKINELQMQIDSLSSLLQEKADKV